MIDPERSRRGRSNRRRGNDWERTLAAQLGGRRVGQYGDPADVLTPLLAVQAKCGLAYPERLDRWLRAIPRTGGRLPVLIVGDAPGPGYRRRALIVMDLGDFRDLHGEVGGVR
ncbi:hypothetical protein BH23CHL7_BH23CHL7_20460 [soil metagenome]